MDSSADVSAFVPKEWQGGVVRPLSVAVAAMIVVSLGMLALSFVPARLQLPRVDIGTLPTAAPPAGMSISALPTGTYDSPAAMVTRGGAWDETKHLAATAVLVQHPKGNLLIDTGFGRNLEKQMNLLPWLQHSPHRKVATVFQQLAAAGLRPASLAAIIPTHAHWDHISGIADLLGVPVLEDAEGIRFISTRKTGTEVINSIPSVRYQKYVFEGAAYLGFPRSHDVFGDGSVVIVPAPGHTPDSVIIFVNLPSGTRYAFVGDMVFQKQGIEIPAEKPWLLRWLIGENRDEINLEIARIKTATLRYPILHAIPAHDITAFDILPVFPSVTR